MHIVGTGFQSGVVVVLDGIRVTPRFDPSDTAVATMDLETPPHGPGTVDVIVANPDGQFARHAGGHRYVLPETFDTNGAWLGAAGAGSHRAVGFTIQNGKLLRAYASCDGANSLIDLPLAESTGVARGTFSVRSVRLGAPSEPSDAVEIMSGRIVSATEMVGTINFKNCATEAWRARVSWRPGSPLMNAGG